MTEPILWVLIAALAAGCLFLFLARKRVLARLAALHNQVRDLRAGGTAVLAMEGKDEVGLLAADLSGALRALREAQEKQLEGERGYREVVEQTAEGIVLVDPESKRILEANRAFRELLRYKPDDLRGLTLYEIIDEDRHTVQQDLQPVLLERKHFDGERRLRPRSGPLIDAKLSANLISQGGRHTLCLVVSSITKEKQVRALLAESTNQFEGAFEYASIGMGLTRPNGVWVRGNQALCDLLGYTVEQLEGGVASLKGTIHAEDWPQVQRAARLLAARETDAFHGELRFLDRGGQTVWVQLSMSLVRDAEDKPLFFIVQVQDITQRKKQEAQLQHLAYHDPLTNLPNRRALEESLVRVVSRSRRGHKSALLMCDLDNFKVVNDTMGHAAGDRLLNTLGSILEGTLRPEDLLARLGGDEFAILLEDTGLEEARIAAERLRQAVDEYRFSLEGRPFALGLSIGISPIDGRLNPAEATALADAALYAAKNRGKNRVVIYETREEEQIKLAEASAWASRIKDGLRDEKFLLFVQAVVRLDNGEPEHYEVLIRMKDDNGGLVPPGTFIPAAERFGLMPQMDRWIVDRALVLLRQYPDVRLFVNLSGQSLGEDGVLDAIEARVREEKVPPGRLVFELTETVAITDMSRAQRWMARFKELGVGFALDDFGIGFSSFSYLQALPADYVKIDGSFVKSLLTEPANRSIVQAMNTVAHALDKEVIAEWVENQAIADALQELGIEFGQGYLWGKAFPSENLPRNGRH